MCDKLDYKQAAERLGITVGTLRNKVSNGEIQILSWREGKKVFFDPLMIDSLLQNKMAMKITVSLPPDELYFFQEFCENAQSQIRNGLTTPEAGTDRALTKILDAIQVAIEEREANKP